MRTRLLLLFVPLLVSCQAADLTFAAIPWGSPAEEVRGRMAEQGYDFLAEVNERGDHLYAGSYIGRRAAVVARMAEGRLVKFEVGLKPDEGEERALFREVEARLAEQYGSGRGTVLREGGDPAKGWRAAPVGEFVARSVWSREAADGESYLILENRPELAVVISFESPAWHAEYLRRESERSTALP